MCAGHQTHKRGKTANRHPESIDWEWGRMTTKKYSHRSEGREVPRRSCRQCPMLLTTDKEKLSQRKKASPTDGARELKPQADEGELIKYQAPGNDFVSFQE